MLSQLDALVAQVASKVKDLSVREIQIVDTGDGVARAGGGSLSGDCHEVLSTLKA